MTPLSLAGQNCDRFARLYDNGDSPDSRLHWRVNSDIGAVFRLAAPPTADLCAIANDLVEEISVEMESRLSNEMRCRYNSDNKLDVWASYIISWTGYSAPFARAGSQRSDNREPRLLRAYETSERYEKFLLFVAHYVKACVNKKAAAGLIDPEECRLILPIRKPGNEYEVDEVDDLDRVDILFSCYNEPKARDYTGCVMAPVSHDLEILIAPTLFPILAGAEVENFGDCDDPAIPSLAAKTQRVYFHQHNRRFAWGLYIFNQSVHAYVFGPNVMWSSKRMDLVNVSGRREFISLLVNWSLCSADCLGFDPSIRYAPDNEDTDHHLEIDVHEKNASTGEVATRTYYCNNHVLAANDIFGRHARYFSASDSLETIDDPAFLIKDMWTPLNCGDSSSGEARDEKSTLDTLQAAFEGDSKLCSRFPQFVSTGLVHLSEGGKLVEDTAGTAFAKLLVGFTQFSDRQHTRTVIKQTGRMISAAENQGQVVIAIADAMGAHNAAYVNCNILHGNISDRAILFLKTADGFTGALADFGVAANSDVPATENAEAPRTRLDDWESLLYVVIFLATYGVNDGEREQFFYQRLRKEYPLRAQYWVAGNMDDIANHKRKDMNSTEAFSKSILSKMPKGLLRDLAVDIFKALFCHPGCSGAIKQIEQGLELKRQQLLQANPDAIFVRPRHLDPLDSRDKDEDVIVANLLSVVARHKQAVLAAQ
ncbi:hypothetical protein IWW38_002246 [Coemansia aciculifera]|uniref:Uncharacterized protein n=1 Tax=Coemansia aciculifera TaxID=417176 RepID=A0ACC1M516_9FUNG|nr:hypothetical protein IWW38_002246 [Coemansia aciculifera]